MNQEDKKLNKKQLEAVRYGQGPLLIIAGAGTGKTTVITERIKWLVSSGKAKTSEILALTFTEKAAREMEERVDVAMPYGYTDMWISTFHSFCDRALRQEAIHIGLNPNYKLMTEAETTQFLIKNLFKFKLNYFRPLGNPTKFVSGMLQHFSRLRDEDVSFNEYLRWVQVQSAKCKVQNKKSKSKLDKEEIRKFRELAGAYKTYGELKVKEGVMDFADLISNALKLFRQRKNVLRQYRKQFKYLLVDEFQDTNYAQNELIILLAGRKANLTVVADDDQSIYKWRGAAIANVIQFKKHFRKAKIISLTDNYRSTQLILDHAYQLIQNNNPDRLEAKEKIDKKLKAVREVKGEPIEFLYADRVENEADSVAKKIIELTTEPGHPRGVPQAGRQTSQPRLTVAQHHLGGEVYEYKDIAILVRANNHADAFVRALSRSGIPYQFLGPGQLFRQAEVKDLIAYLKVLYDIVDNVALYRVLSMAVFDLSARDLAAINSYSHRQNLSFFEACERVEEIFVSQETKEKIKRFIEMANRHLKLLPKETAGQILYYFLEDTGLLKKLAEYKSPTEEKQSQNIAKFFDKLKTYEVDHEDASVQAVVDWINLAMELGESPLASDIDWVEENKVNLLTVHSSKGLEFPVVFLVNLVMARFPTQERKEQIPIPEDLIKEVLPVGDYHEQEERRLFYVGMTRACDRLFLTAANYYAEGKREKRLSPFIAEAIGDKEIKKLEREKLRKSETQQLSFLDFAPLPTLTTRPTTHFPPPRPITYLSFSQIESFNNCPRQYRFRYLQRIPTPPSAAQSFGDSIHKTLRDFYREIKNGEKLTKKDLWQLLETNWSSQGYASKAHEKRMKERGRKILADFYKQANWKMIPKDLEQTFIIRISSDLKIGGKIDRVDEKGNRLEIIDYKTGRVMEQKDVDGSLQMTTYALAAVDQGIYGKKPEEIILSFYFLDPGEKKSTKRTAEQLKNAKKELIEKAKEIEKSDFPPLPSRLCEFCEYRLLCEAWA